MSYVYRYDPLLSHLRMHGGKLRARRWNSAEGSFEHTPLLAAEGTLDDGETLFAIFFWKNLSAAKLRMSWRLWNEMHVLQRVREDHPFFQNYHRVDDDKAGSAWLYWRKALREPEQSWSRDGIERRDIEVLDLDGRWRAMPDSMLMASTHSRLTAKGFQSHYYMVNGLQPAVVFWVSRLLTLPSGDTYVALLLQHPQESRYRIYNDEYVMKAIVDGFIERGGKQIPVERLRLFVVDEGINTSDASHLIEVPLSGAWQSEATVKMPTLRWPWRRSRQSYRYTVNLGKREDWKWSRLENEHGALVLSAFELSTTKENINRYGPVIGRASEEVSATAKDILLSGETARGLV